MPISDVVVGNLTTLYLAAIAAVKVYGLASGRAFGGAFVIVVSTAMVGGVLVGTLIWDVSQKAAKAMAHDHHRRHAGDEVCNGGICWHGVAARSPVSQVQFRLPPHQHPQNLE
ncbi:uncharacterized protein LOC127808245 [Diospyros lotus]|uniref:uncharacterized protein LOC127808245 n=1 Tax=Diospyros lotus TaxID=55363 RepID=UPI00225A43D1|nr:uncharacterized protein LOC127808245 [Diospyros lotus]